MSAEKVVAAGGVLAGAGFGLVGGLAPIGAIQDVSYLLSSIGFVTGLVVLALRSHATRHALHAAGFLVLALGEVAMMSGFNRAADPNSAGAFAAGVALYAPGLLLVSLPRGHPIWSRVAGALAALPFGAHAILRSAGVDLDYQDLTASVGYGLLSVAIAGWIWRLRDAPANARDGADPVRGPPGNEDGAARL